MRGGLEGQRGNSSRRIHAHNHRGSIGSTAARDRQICRFRNRIHREVVHQNLIRSRAEHRGDFLVNARNLDFATGTRRRPVFGVERDDRGVRRIADEQDAVRPESQRTSRFELGLTRRQSRARAECEGRGERQRHSGLEEYVGDFHRVHFLASRAESWVNIITLRLAGTYPLISTTGSPPASNPHAFLNVTPKTCLISRFEVFPQVTQIIRGGVPRRLTRFTKSRSFVITTASTSLVASKMPASDDSTKPILLT